MANILFIDNFDSFTYNLVDQFRSLGHLVTIYRNNLSADAIEQALQQLDNPVVVLSPGQVHLLKRAVCQSCCNA